MAMIWAMAMSEALIMPKRYGKATNRHRRQPSVPALVRAIQMRYLALLKNENPKTFKELATETGLSYYALR